MDMLIDASAIMPVLINEPEKAYIVSVTKNGEFAAPSMLPHEIGNALTRLKKRQILDSKQILAAYRDFKKIPLRLLETDIEDALKIACKYAIYAYDAYYLEIASRLHLPLLTLDRSMKRIALDLKIRVVGE